MQASRNFTAIDGYRQRLINQLNSFTEAQSAVVLGDVKARSQIVKALRFLEKPITGLPKAFFKTLGDDVLADFTFNYMDVDQKVAWMRDYLKKKVVNDDGTINTKNLNAIEKEMGMKLTNSAAPSRLTQLAKVLIQEITDAVDQQSHMVADALYSQLGPDSTISRENLQKALRLNLLDQSYTLPEILAGDIDSAYRMPGDLHNDIYEIQRKIIAEGLAGYGGFVATQLMEKEILKRLAQHAKD